MAEAALFDFDGALRVRVRGLAARALHDLNRKFDRFAAGDHGPADIEVDIGPFEPDIRGATHVDHRYFIREDHVSFSEDARGHSFRAEITGLVSGPMRVRYQARPSGVHPSRFLYPDQVLHNHVLQPLIEARLGLAGRFLLHGAGVAKDGRAALLIGRGCSFKTTYAFRLCREGYDVLGDDLVLFDAAHVRAFPGHAGFFDYHVRCGMEHEGELRGARKAGMVLHLLGRPRPVVRFAAPARPAKVVLLDIREGLARPSSRPIGPREAARKAWLNARMERHPASPAGHRIGNFLEAYHLVHPGNPLADHWERGGRCLSALFADPEAHLMETGPEWTDDNLAVMRRLAAL